MTKPEDVAREEIDRQLLESGWVIQNQDEINLSAGQGVAVRYFQMKTGHGEADYLLFIDGRAVGVLEAKKIGFPLTGCLFRSKWTPYPIQTGQLGA